MSLSYDDGKSTEDGVKVKSRTVMCRPIKYNNTSTTDNLCVQ
jgi:hypothetical protein